MSNDAANENYHPESCVDEHMIGAARKEVGAVNAGGAPAHVAAAESVTLESPAGRRSLATGGGESPFAGPPPDSFAGYQLLKEIHRGGQGVVYQALQKSTNRKVAIKVMKEGPFAGAADKARFDREVQILGQLNHPNIVTIHDTGVAAGCHFFVMDYISGQPLDVYMASRERSIEETLRLFNKICDAVNAAHLKGVIHRDLKPGNIRVDENGEPHVLDFGLAKVAASVAEASVMTITGQFIGSLPWASPEQAEGVPGKIDVRTDVYSLGVILYQMLTGRFPYDVIGNMRDVLDRIMKAEPVRPSSIRRQVNDEVETLVMKCLQKERDRRYQTAGELGRDVYRYLKGEPIEAKRDSAWYVLSKTLRRYAVPTAVAFGLLVSGLAGGAVLTVLYQGARRESHSAQMSLQAATNALDRASVGEWSGFDSNLMMRGRNLRPEQVQTCEERLKAKPDDLELRSLLLSYYFLPRFTSAEARQAREAHIMWIIRNRPDAEIAGGPEADFDARLEPGAYKEAAKLWLEAVEMRGESPTILGNAARFFQLQDPQQAAELLKNAQAIDPANPEWPRRLGHLYALQSRRRLGVPFDADLPKKSLESHEKAIESSQGPSRYYALRDVARAALDAGDLEKAGRYANELLASATEAGRDWNYGNAVHHGNLVLGSIALRTGEVETAEAYLLKAGATPGSPQLNSFGPNMSLAKELLEQGRKEAVVKYLRDCGRFWKDSKLDDWIVLAEGGRIPDFGANLNY